MIQLPLDMVAFDLTGTTVVDAGVMAYALKGALDRHGVPYTEADVVAMRGASKQAAFRSLVERTVGKGREAGEVDSLMKGIFSTFNRLLREGYTSGSVEEVPGSEATIRWLRERGVKVAATTALAGDLCDLVLSRLGWDRGLFDCRVASDEVSRGRPAPYMVFLAMMRVGARDVRRVATVGDTTLDLKAGVNAGAGWVIGVLSGVYGLEVLGATPHTHLLNSVADLQGIFQIS